MRGRQSRSEVNNRMGRHGRDGPTTVQDIQKLATAAEESLPLGDGGGLCFLESSAPNGASNVEDEEKGGNGAFSGIPAEVMRESHTIYMSLCFNERKIIR